LFLKLLRLILIGLLGVPIVVGMVTLGTYLYLAPGLPGVATLKDIELQVPLKVYSRDAKLIAVFGEKRRQPLDIEAFPEQVIQAFLAAEDARFFEHPGVDYHGLVRAAVDVLLTGEKRQGGSTITMQLARNFFLGNERTYVRKFREILLALRIEHELTKNEILELYLNKIYLGNRAYGVGAAADVYYGIGVTELTLAQITMIAGLPKAPSRFNPIANAERAVVRRNYVLGRMKELQIINQEAYAKAIKVPVTASLHYPRVEANAPYVGEMVRAFVAEAYGAQVYNKGFRVFTTIDTKFQQVANQAVIGGLLAYDRRHGYRGPESHIESIHTARGDIDFGKLDQILSGAREIGGLIPAVVTQAKPQEIEFYLDTQQTAKLSIDNAKWAKPYKNENVVGKEPEDLTKMFVVGDVIRVVKGELEQWSLAQVPEVSGAFVAINPQNGSVLALVGGFDYNHSKFNRAIQAKRQPGSSFKPFIYSAALESGYTPASVINDAPMVFEDTALEDTWRPKNYGGKFFGPTRLRDALIKSRNMVSIRLLKDIGNRHATKHITKFGFDRERLPYNLTLALGSGTVSPLELATGYAVFANGGYAIKPFVVERIEDIRGEVLYQSNSPMVCEEDCQALQQQMEIELNSLTDENEEIATQAHVAKRVLAKGNAYQMVSMLQDVIQHGTGVRARVIGRNDLAGKTGTTNDQLDAWFSGFNSDVVATAWVGFDQNKPLGRREIGGVAALPIWIEFMQTVLKGKPEKVLKRPKEIITLRIDPATGHLVDQDSDQGIEETFREGYAPNLSAVNNKQSSNPYFPKGHEQIEIPEQVF
jgi:penicillin-binding protein 1A